MPKEIHEVLWKLMEKNGRRGKIPEDWNRRIICPIFKKEEKSEVKNYNIIKM